MNLESLIQAIADKDNDPKYAEGLKKFSLPRKQCQKIRPTAKQLLDKSNSTNKN